MQNHEHNLWARGAPPREAKSRRLDERVVTVLGFRGLGFIYGFWVYGVRVMGLGFRVQGVWV